MSRAWFEVVERMARVEHLLEGSLLDPELSQGPRDEAGLLGLLETARGWRGFIPGAQKLWVVPEMMQLLRAAAGDVALQRVHRAALPWPNAFVALPSGAPTAVYWQWVRFQGKESLRFGWLRPSPDDPRSDRLTSNEPIPESEPFDEYEGEDSVEHDVRALLQALWLLIQQRVLVTQPVEPIRQARRQWERSHSTPVPTVQEIVWRKTYERPQREGNPLVVDWSHRWMVSGHWRNQWLPAEATHRQTWVNPHIKGPPEKPLVLKERVNVWKR